MKIECLSVCLSVFLVFVCFTDQIESLSVCLSVCLFFRKLLLNVCFNERDALMMCLSVLSVCLFVSMSLYLSVYLSECLMLVFVSVHLSFFFLLVCFLIRHVFYYWYVHLSFCPSVCLFAF
jgi:hypothetical protein